MDYQATSAGRSLLQARPLGREFIVRGSTLASGCRSSLIPSPDAGEIGASMAVLRVVLLGMTGLAVVVIVVLNAVTARRETSRRKPLIAYEPQDILGMASRAKREAKRRVLAPTDVRKQQRAPPSAP
jgi:hypothetical protein